MLRLARRTVPAGSVLDVESCTFDAISAQNNELRPPAAPAPAASDALSDAERGILDAWTSGTAPGWPQVRAIVTQIRERGRFVRGYRSAATDPALTVLHGGPGDDLHFATAAALALRSMGYRVRMASGFYVRPDAADPDTGQTVVTAADVHTWPEIRLPTGAWVPLEPTPGYTLLTPRITLLTRAQALGRTCGAWAARHARTLVATLVAAAAGWFLRRRVVEWTDTAVWRVRRRPPPDAVAATVALIERRARRWHVERPPHETRSAWLGRLGRRSAGTSPVPFDPWVQWADYGEGTPMPDGDCRSLCRQIAATFDGRALRRLARSDGIRT